MYLADRNVDDLHFRLGLGELNAGGTSTLNDANYLLGLRGSLEDELAIEIFTVI